MIKRFLRWLFAPAPVMGNPMSTPAGRSVFTTDLGDDLDRQVDRGKLLARINERQFGNALAAIRVIPDGGSQSGLFAQDSAEDFASIKGIFGLNQIGLPDVQASWFGSQGFIGYQMCAIIAQHWLVNKACAVPARDAIRKGFVINVPDAAGDPVAVHAALIKADKKYKLKRNLVEFVKMGRVFGVRVAMFKFDNVPDDFYTAPFNADGIRPSSYRGIVQVDPYWMVPELTTSAAMDPSSIDFYEPTFWVLNGRRVHKSHLVIFKGPEVADVLKPSYLYGGMSIPQMIFERVYAAERCANESPQLLLTKRTTVFYTDVSAALANKKQFDERLQDWTGWRDNHAVKVADKEADKMEQTDTGLADLDATIMTQYQLVAAIANVPATKLLGTSPKGFGAAGDYEIENYHEELETVQEDMLPLIERHHLCVMRSDVLPMVTGAKLAPLEIVFNTLDSLTAEEQANVNKVKADTDAVLVTAGVLAADEVRERLAADKWGGYEGLEVLDDMDPPVEEIA